MQRLTWMVGAVALGICIGGTALAARKTGWSVLICRGQTEASAIKITVSDGKAHKVLANWQSDNKKTKFAVPSPMTMAKKLSVTADSEPADGKVVMCIMWDHGAAKTMKFNDLLTASAGQKDKDDSCPCK